MSKESDLIRQIREIYENSNYQMTHAEITTELIRRGVPVTVSVVRHTMYKMGIRIQKERSDYIKTR